MAEISPEQSRAARVLLDMTEEQLAAAANVGLGTLRSFEAESSKPTPNSLRSIRLALERGGIELVAANGADPVVRLAARGPHKS